MLSRDPLSPGCKREPSRSNPLLQSPSKHGKRSWETLIDSLALVGFTDALPNQKCKYPANFGYVGNQSGVMHILDYCGDSTNASQHK